MSTQEATELEAAIALELQRFLGQRAMSAGEVKEGSTTAGLHASKQEAKLVEVKIIRANGTVEYLDLGTV